THAPREPHELVRQADQPRLDRLAREDVAIAGERVVVVDRHHLARDREAEERTHDRAQVVERLRAREPAAVRQEAGRLPFELAGPAAYGGNAARSSAGTDVGSSTTPSRRRQATCCSPRATSRSPSGPAHR